MDEKPEDKKKESIDDILSDLNGLLNKMPSILDGIKMPEMQPHQPPAQPEPAPELPPAQPEEVQSQPESAPEQPQEIPVEDAGDKTVVLEPFSGLPEGAASPDLGLPRQQEEPAAEAPAEPPAMDGDKTVVLEPFSGLSEGAQEPPAGGPETAPEQPQEISLEVVQPEPAAEQPEEINLEAVQPGPAAEQPEEMPAEEELQSADILSPSDVFQQEPASEPAQAEADTVQPAAADIPEPAEPAAAAPPPQAALPAYESTRDFGVPDIDALLQLSDADTAGQQQEQAEQQAADLPEAGVIPESVQAIEQQPDSIKGIEPAPQAEIPAAEEVQMENKEPDNEPQQPEPEQQEQPEAAAQPAADSPFDAFAIDPSAEPEAQPEPAVQQAEPAQAEAAPEILSLEPAAEEAPQSGGLELNLQQDAPAPQEGQPLQFESPAEAVGGTPPDAAGETLNLEPRGGSPFDVPEQPAAEAEPTLTVGAQPEAADQTIPGGGLELGGGSPFGEQPQAEQPQGPGGAGLELSVGTPGGGGDETLVMPPPGGDSPEEEKTVIFQAPPSTTSRAQAGDLTGLAEKGVPDGIPEDRVRSLMFLYSSEDKALCATVLAELDSICLKSATKPMFIKRAAVQEFEADANPNFVQQAVTDSGAQGLICVGSVPQDKVYELESLFGSSNGFFRHYESASFSHSAALDLVTDIILR